MSEVSWDPEQFCGTARLFPLPNLVLFPQVRQPLHIFEPRYRQMTADALVGDRLIALVLLQPGWDTNYDGRPAIHRVACLGKIVAEQALPDGRYNLLLRGVARAVVIEEVTHDKLYRSARVELPHEGPAPKPATDRKLRRQLGKAVLSWFSPKGPAMDQLQKFLKGDMPLGILCDLLGFAAPLTVEAKQQLLEEFDVERRARQLLSSLESSEPPEASESEKTFPPGFSAN